MGNPLLSTEDLMREFGVSRDTIYRWNHLGTGPTRVRVGDNSQGLDEVPGYQPRPPGLGLTGARGSDIVTVGRTYTV